jgi:glucoamylase
VVDQGFLELVRLGELPASSPLVTNSLKVTGATISAPTPSGTGIMRYNGDGYGDCELSVFEDCQVNGQPWATTDEGTGHPWPVLSGENGEYQILAGGSSALGGDLDFMLNSSSGVGLVPEQVWNYPDVPASPYGSDPATASIGFTDGQADGSAAPLTWAQAQLLRLISDQAAGKLLEQPSIVAARYQSSPPAAAPLTVTAPLSVSGGNVPANLTRPTVVVNGATTTVTGTTSAGATVDVAVSGTAAGAAAPATTITTATAGSSGAFSVTVSLQPGTDSIEVAATAGRATNEAILSVVSVPGTVVLSAAPAPGGGNGPGSYAYPTATNSDGSPVFAPDSFRLNGLSVVEGTSTVTFEVGIVNLQSTFGSLDGAQLIDLYIHAPSGSVPAGETQSTAAAGAWNYSIAPADAWNQLIEVDGFGTDDWVTPASATSGLSGSSSVGTPQVSVIQLAPAASGETPGLVTITVPTAELGTPGAGWTFTVTLTGQDGFGNDDARTFTATPGDYTFGVCSAAVAAESSPPAICSYNPANVPIVMDTIPPASVNVQTELDPTVNTSGVALQGVTVP